MDSETIRVLVADDQVLFCHGIAKMLEATRCGIDVVGTALDGRQVVEMSRVLLPDVVLMDIKMPHLNGIEATRAIKVENPGIRIILLTIYDTDRFILEGIQAGATGYVLKDSTPDELVQAIKAVYAGESLISPAIANQVLDMFARLAKGEQQALSDHDLTPRETEILTLIASGIASKEIARQLNISDKTVRNHISNIYQKLHIYDRAQIVLYAVKKGLVKP